HHPGRARLLARAQASRGFEPPWSARADARSGPGWIELAGTVLIGLLRWCMIHSRALLGAVALLATACSKPSPSGITLDRAVREPSGITASPAHSNVFWVHGDSGTGNWLFGIDGQGRTLARLRVKG